MKKEYCVRRFNYIVWSAKVDRFNRWLSAEMTTNQLTKELHDSFAARYISFHIYREERSYLGSFVELSRDLV